MREYNSAFFGLGNLLTLMVSVESRRNVISSSQTGSIAATGMADSGGQLSQQQADRKKMMRSLFLKVF
jgi:hypothetical protein